MTALPIDHLTPVQEHLLWFGGAAVVVVLLTLCITGAIESFQRGRERVDGMFLEAEAGAAAARTGSTVDEARYMILDGWVLDDATGEWNKPEVR